MPRRHRTLSLAAGLAVMGLVAGCSSGPLAPTSSPTPPSTLPAPATPSPATPSPATPSPAPSAGTGSVVVTFRAADGSTWRARLVDPADIAIARDLAAGRPAPGIPNGRIVRGSPDVNTGWSWHLDPADFEWADMTTEVCDGNPQGVEDGTLTSDRYCPWTVTVVAVDPAP